MGEENVLELDCGDVGTVCRMHWNSLSCELENGSRGAWVAQWVKASAFGSCHDPRVLGSSLASGSMLSGEPASPSAPLSRPLILSLSKISKLFKKLIK